MSAFKTPNKFLVSLVIALLLTNFLVGISYGAVVVSNLDQSEIYGSQVGRLGGTVQRVAQQFTMGNTSTILGSVDLLIYSDSANTTTFEVYIHADNAGVPSSAGTKLTGTINPAVGIATYTYTDAGTYALAASTNYWIVAQAQFINGEYKRWSFTDSAAQNSSTGATIANSLLYNQSLTNNATWASDPGLSQMLAINDLTVVPEPSRALLAFTGLIFLTLRRRR